MNQTEQPTSKRALPTFEEAAQRWAIGRSSPYRVLPGRRAPHRQGGRNADL